MLPQKNYNWFHRVSESIHLGIRTKPVNGYQKNHSLWSEILKIDLSETLKNVDIPYIIFQGDTDIVASTLTVSALVKNSDNPNLKCEIVENSGHVPGSAGMERVFEELCAFERN